MMFDVEDMNVWWLYGSERLGDGDGDGLGNGYSYNRNSCEQADHRLFEVWGDGTGHGNEGVVTGNGWGSGIDELGDQT